MMQNPELVHTDEEGTEKAKTWRLGWCWDEGVGQEVAMEICPSSDIGTAWE